MLKKRASLQHSAGFSLPETILILAILAILLTAMFPAVVSYFDNAKYRDEVAAQKEIIKSFDVYLRQTGELESNIITATSSAQAWNRAYNSFTNNNVVVGNMSLDEMRTDAYGNARGLIVDRQQVTFNGGSYFVYYVGVISRGNDGCYGTGAGCPALPTRFRQIAAPTGSFTLADYNDLEVAANADDIITKYTDSEIKIAAYNDMLQRIFEIEEALAFYAEQKELRAMSIINERCHANTTMAYSYYNCLEAIRSGGAHGIGDLADSGELLSGQIFVPRSCNAAYSAAGSSFDVSIDGTRTVLQDVIDSRAAVGAGSGNCIVNTNSSTVANRNTRKANMQALMHLLGLPQSYCCHSLQRYYNSATNTWSDVPMYYYASPADVTVDFKP